MHPEICWCLEKCRKSLRRCSEHLWGALFSLSVSEFVCTPWGQILVRDDTSFPRFPIKSHNTNTSATTQPGLLAVPAHFSLSVLLGKQILKRQNSRNNLSCKMEKPIKILLSLLMPRFEGTGLPQRWCRQQELQTEFPKARNLKVKELTREEMYF